jgi:3-mercaptopyruvate sulfurtransferase SseA
MSPKRKQKNQNPIPLLLIITGGLLLISALVWSLSGFQGTANNTPEELSQDIPFAEIERVSLADARTAYDNGTAIFLDVRDSSAYAAGHIPGAISTPLEELENNMNNLERDQWIITYCT